MIPFTGWLTTSCDTARAVGTFTATQLPILPVFGSDGQFHGVVRHEDVMAHAQFGPSDDPLQSLAVSDFVRLQDDADFDVVMEHFFADHDAPIIVFSDEKPRGFLTRNSFASLVATVDCGSFAPLDDARNAESWTVPDIDRDGDVEAAVRPTAAQRAGLSEKMGPGEN